MKHHIVSDLMAELLVYVIDALSRIIMYVQLLFCVMLVAIKCFLHWALVQSCQMALFRMSFTW